MPRREIHDVRFQHPSGAGALVEVLRLTDLRRRPLEPSLHTSQRRDFHLFQLVTAGTGCHHLDFGSVALAEGDVFHLRPGQVDRFDEDSDHEALLLLFVPEALASPAVLPVRLTNPLRPEPAEFERLESLARLIGRFQAEPALQASSLTLLQGFAQALDALHTRATSASGSSASKDLCERFEQLLEEPPVGPRTVAWYADRLGVSAKTLARASADVFGRTPKQHIDTRVTLQAKRLLVHSKDTVESIAIQLGFTEPTNFVKFFRRVESCTPQAFRERFHAAAAGR